MLREIERSEIRQCYRRTKSANVIGGKKTMTIILIGLIALISYDAYARSRSTPSSSNKMSGKESRFSLEDPRVALNKIKEANAVKEPPVKGKANDAIKNALAVYFKTGSSSVKIVSGYSSRNKIIEIIS